MPTCEKVDYRLERFNASRPASPRIIPQRQRSGIEFLQEDVGRFYQLDFRRQNVSIRNHTYLLDLRPFSDFLNNGGNSFRCLPNGVVRKMCILLSRCRLCVASNFPEDVKAFSA